MTDIIGGCGAGPLFPVPVIVLFIAESTNVWKGTAQDGWFIVPFYNIVFTVPATIFGHILWLNGYYFMAPLQPDYQRQNQLSSFYNFKIPPALSNNIFLDTKPGTVASNRFHKQGWEIMPWNRKNHVAPCGFRTPFPPTLFDPELINSGKSSV